MARWAIYANYGHETMEAEVCDPDLITEQDAINDFLTYVKVWAEKVGDE